MKTGYFPGCSMHGTAREFDESLRAVALGVGVELEEVRDWNCCGASSAHALNAKLAVALPARTLALAESQGVEQVLAPCAACYNRLLSALRAIRGDDKLRQELPAILGRPLERLVTVRNILEVLADALPVITGKISVNLRGLKVACYYGCLLVRPAHVTCCDDPEQPTTMEQIAAACGAQPVKWNMALECCGGAMSICRTRSVVRLGRAIVQDARKAGAKALLVACPMCHSNLDFRQQTMTRDGEEPLPVLYVTQLVGLAMGIEAEELGLERHFVGTAPVASAIGGPLPVGRN